MDYLNQATSRAPSNACDTCGENFESRYFDRCYFKCCKKCLLISATYFFLISSSIFFRFTMLIKFVWSFFCQEQVICTFRCHWPCYVEITVKECRLLMKETIYILLRVSYEVLFAGKRPIEQTLLSRPEIYEWCTGIRAPLLSKEPIVNCYTNSKEEKGKRKLNFETG